MIGQEFPQPTRVMVFIESDDGRIHGWEVLQPGPVKWEFAGAPRGSTHATVTVTGEFHRITRAAVLNELGTKPLELEQ